MKEPTPREKVRGKGRRVSHRRELAVVTLAAVASISGVGGLLATGHNASVQSVGAARSAITSPAQPGHGQKPLALRHASYRGEEAGDDDGQVILRPARNVDPGRHNGKLARSPASHAHPSAVSRGSAPVN